MGGGEPGRVLLPGRLQGLGALPGGVAGHAVVDVSGRMKANPAMTMVMIVVIDEFGHERPGGLQRAEPFREHRCVFQCFVPGLGVR